MQLTRAGGALAALAAAALAAGCGASAVSAPATARQATARLVTTAQLPDGIRSSGSSAQLSVRASAGPPLAQMPCDGLLTPQTFFSYGPAPKLADSVGLSRRPAGLALPLGWLGGEDLLVFPGNDATQTMSFLIRLVGRCAATPQDLTAGGTELRAHEGVTILDGIGDLGLDVQVRYQDVTGTTVSRDVVASDWIVISVGSALLVVYELPTPVISSSDAAAGYLNAAARAALAAYEQ